MNDKVDHHGNDIPADEPEDKPILVWVISPGTDGCDEHWIRDYHEAVDFACERLTDAVDEMSEDDAIQHGTTLKMKLRWTTVEEYAIVCARES